MKKHPLTPAHALCLAIIGLLSACSTVQPSLIDYDTQYNFTPLKTYQWANTQTPMSEDIKNKQALTNTVALNKKNAAQLAINTPNHDLLNARITRYIDAALLAQGFTLSENHADFLITYETRAQSLTARDTYYYNPFSLALESCSIHRIGCDNSHLRGETREYKLSKLFLVLNVLSTTDKRVIWQGIARLPNNRVNESAESYDNAIRQGVNTILSQFPPRPAAVQSPPR